MDGVWDALRVTLLVASLATAVAIVPACFLGYLLARVDFRGKSIVETLVALPLFLPPTAVGYLLLGLFAVDGPLGRETLGIDLDILLTFKGAVVAAAVMSMPLVARTARVAFEGVPPRLERMGRSLGMSRVRVLTSVTLPLAGRGLIAASFLGFARAMGEFGATVLVAGNVPGKTQTLALAIFSDIQARRDSRALALVGVTVLISFGIVWSVEMLQKRRSFA